LMPSAGSPIITKCQFLSTNVWTVGASTAPSSA
jgi:hypothetical protein